MRWLTGSVATCDICDTTSGFDSHLILFSDFTGLQSLASDFTLFLRSGLTGAGDVRDGLDESFFLFVSPFFFS